MNSSILFIVLHYNSFIVLERRRLNKMGVNTMDKGARNEEAMQNRIQRLEIENEQLYQIVRQLNTTLQKLIEIYVLPEK